MGEITGGYFSVGSSVIHQEPESENAKLEKEKKTPTKNALNLNGKDLNFQANTIHLKHKQASKAVKK